MIQSFNFTAREKVIIFTGILFGLLAAFYYFAFLPQQQLLNAKKTEIKNIKKELVAVKKIATDADYYAGEVQTLQEKDKKLLAAMPASSNTSELAENIEDLTHKNNLTLVEFKPALPANDGSYKQIPVNITLSGNYLSLANFMQEFERLPRIKSYRGFTLLGNMNNHDGSSQYTLVLDMMVFANK